MGKQEYILDNQSLTLGEIFHIQRRRKEYHDIENGIVDPESDKEFTKEFIKAVENDNYEEIKLSEIVEYAAFYGLYLHARVIPREEKETT